MNRIGRAVYLMTFRFLSVIAYTGGEVFAEEEIC